MMPNVSLLPVSAAITAQSKSLGDPVVDSRVTIIRNAFTGVYSTSPGVKLNIETTTEIAFEKVPAKIRGMLQKEVSKTKGYWAAYPKYRDAAVCLILHEVFESKAKNTLVAYLLTGQGFFKGDPWYSVYDVVAFSPEGQKLMDERHSGDPYYDWQDDPSPVEGPRTSLPPP